MIKKSNDIAQAMFGISVLTMVFYCGNLMYVKESNFPSGEPIITADRGGYSDYQNSPMNIKLASVSSGSASCLVLEQV